MGLYIFIDFEEYLLIRHDYKIEEYSYRIKIFDKMISYGCMRE